jgi:hypothetical protein
MAMQQALGRIRPQVALGADRSDDEEEDDDWDDGWLA